MLQRGEAAQERGLGVRQVQVAVAARQWKATAGEIRTAMLLLWDGSRFLARNAETGETGTSTSLLGLMPIAVGAGLSGQVSDIFAGCSAAHLTAHGPATEPTDSAQYASDGYWRGPIWAPSTVLIEDGLRRAGMSPSPTRSASGAGSCARSPALPRTSTPRPAPGCATAPAPGPPPAT
ncbi:MGH1-like glycoside hydrolase domain-containing protein [Actinoplanes regularis]|uniref:MGH1-like glycoside hydrolase domain-containing protein n=1 Tax=Actinoplanes regularis TaxID=52697 RepID=UPI0025555B2A|nr:hypothetical protein [Actinoplanes regularis]